MEEARANSMRVYFGPGKREPTDHEIFQFMKLKMRVSCTSLLSMYKEAKEHSVYIKFKTEDLLKDALLNLPSNMEFAYDKYESTTVTFSAASSVFKYVRIFNLPPEINDQEISTVISKYGIIQRMVREKYAPETGFPIWSSVRGIHMEIKHEIPATIHVRNFQARVFYEGLKNKCFLCGSKEHVKVNCPKRVNVNQRMEQNGELSYSAVAARSERWLGRMLASKTAAETEKDGGQMIVLNNRFSTKPSKSSDDTITTDENMQQEELGNGSSETCREISFVAVPNDKSTGANETGEAATQGTPSQLSTTGALIVYPISTVATEGDDGEGEFQFVKDRKKKKVVQQYKRSVSTDSVSVTGTIFIPPSNISADQGTITRGRTKQKQNIENRSRSRSNHESKNEVVQKDIQS